jgi:hypothetical protein
MISASGGGIIFKLIRDVYLRDGARLPDVQDLADDEHHQETQRGHDEDLAQQVLVQRGQVDSIDVGRRHVRRHEFVEKGDIRSVIAVA